MTATPRAPTSRATSTPHTAPKAAKVHGHELSVLGAWATLKAARQAERVARKRFEVTVAAARADGATTTGLARVTGISRSSLWRSQQRTKATP